MNVWIDVAHTPQYNFYYHTIKSLLHNGDSVYLTILDRGRLVKIINAELGSYNNLNIYVVGKHRLNKLSAIFDANLVRMIKLFFWLIGKNIDIAISNNLFTPCLCWLFRIPNYAFGDDPQVVDYKPKIWFANISHYCIYQKPENLMLSPKIKILRCLKEWASLNPRIFTSNVNALNKYNLIPKEYVFVREVSVGTVNYAGQESCAVKNIQHLIPKDKKVLFSLEEKNRRNEYPEDWILLQEPVDDIHSLIYYSAGLVSSGDSMAREAALLGVPAYYLGIRHSMPANLAASKVANLQNEKTMPFSEWVKTLDTTADEAVKKQEELRAKIDSEFIDINEYMMSLVEKHRK